MERDHQEREEKARAIAWREALDGPTSLSDGSEDSEDEQVGPN